MRALEAMAYGKAGAALVTGTYFVAKLHGFCVEPRWWRTVHAGTPVMPREDYRICYSYIRLLARQQQRAADGAAAGAHGRDLRVGNLAGTGFTPELRAGFHDMAEGMQAAGGELAAVGIER